MKRPLRVFYYNTFLPMHSSEGMVSRQYFRAARRLPAWELTTVLPPRETAVPANGSQRKPRQKFVPAALRRGMRSFLSPISRYPVGPFLHTRRMQQRVTAVLKQNDPFDLAFFHLSQGDLAVLAELQPRLRVPLLLRVPAPLAYEADFVLHRYMSRQDREREQKLYEAADAVLVISAGMKQILVESGISADKILVFPNGVDTKTFAPDAARRQAIRRELGLDGRKVVGYVGSFWPGNDIDTLLQAWQQVEAEAAEAVLLLVGDGARLAEAKALAKRLRLKNCRWLGRVHHADVPQYMAAMDVAVGPYKAEAAAFVSPLKVMEYAAMGLPVVAAAGGQIRDIVRDGETGWTYQPHDADRLAGAVITLLENPAEAVEMGSRARRLMQDWYSWDKIAAEVLQLCQNVSVFSGEEVTAV